MSSHRKPPGQAAPENQPDARERGGSEGAHAAAEHFAFRIELWDEAKSAIEQVLAEASHGSIAFAAYNAAMREHPERYLTLRQRGRVLSSCNAPERSTRSA